MDPCDRRLPGPHLRRPSRSSIVNPKVSQNSSGQVRAGSISTKVKSPDKPPGKSRVKVRSQGQTRSSEFFDRHRRWDTGLSRFPEEVLFRWQAIPFARRARRPSRPIKMRTWLERSFRSRCRTSLSQNFANSMHWMAIRSGCSCVDPCSVDREARGEGARRCQGMPLDGSKGRSSRSSQGSVGSLRGLTKPTAKNRSFGSTVRSWSDRYRWAMSEGCLWKTTTRWSLSWSVFPMNYKLARQFC